jgi:hypothetical protein
MFKNKKGQAFEAYKLLIAFIIATAILGIIVMMINKTNNQAIIISNQKIEDAFLSAINSPIISMQRPFQVKDVMISGIISSTRYEQLGNIEEGCFGFMTGPGVKKEDYGVIVEKKFLKTDIYFVCGLEDMSDSDIILEIWQGVPDDSPFDSNPSTNCEDLFCVMYINRIPDTTT